MQLKIDITIDQLIAMIKNLPAKQMLRIKSEIDDDLLQKAKQEKTDFQKFLLSGPVMTDLQYKQYINNRESMNQWRKL